MSFSPFAALARRKTMLLTSFRRDGQGVSTPVSVAVQGNRAFFRTYDRSGKAKRIRNNPAVEVAPSTFRGRPLGPTMKARAERLSGEEANRARLALARSQPLLQGLLVPVVHRLKGYRTLHYALIAEPESASRGAHLASHA